MSLILEALRKSEAERQRGQAPGLFVQQQALRRRRQASPGAWVGGVLAGVGVLALGWFGWTWLSSRDAARDGPGVATQEVADAGVRTAPPGVAPLDAQASVTDDVGPAAPGDLAGGPTVPADSAPSAVPAPGIPGAPSEGPRVADGVRRPPGPQAPTASAMPAPGADTGPSATAAIAAAPASPADAMAPGVPPAAADVVEPTPVPAPDTAASPVPAAGIAADAPDTTRLPRLVDLPAAERGTLPPMKLSMHVYAPDPAQRFVILDGRRLQEGGALAEGVFVQAITRDGLVLSVRGQPYWLGR